MVFRKGISSGICSEHVAVVAGDSVGLISNLYSADVLVATSILAT